MKTTKFDYSKIDNIEFDGIDHNDYPDFCDAYIVSADYDGEPMSEQQLTALSDDIDFVQEKLHDKLF